MTDTSSFPKKTRTDRDTTLEWELRILDELTEMGLDMARALERRVSAQAAAGEPLSAPGGEDVGLAFERIARDICQAIALSAKLERAMSPRSRPPAGRPAVALDPATPETKTTVH